MKLNFPAPAGSVVMNKCYAAMDDLRTLLSGDHDVPDVQANRAYIVSYILKEMHVFMANIFIQDGPVMGRTVRTVMVMVGPLHSNVML